MAKKPLAVKPFLKLEDMLKARLEKSGEFKVRINPVSDGVVQLIRTRIKGKSSAVD